MNEHLQRKYNNYSGRQKLDPNVWRRRVNSRVQLLRSKNILGKLGFNTMSIGASGKSTSMYNNNNVSNMTKRRTFFNEVIPGQEVRKKYTLEPKNLALLKSIPIKVLVHETRRRYNHNTNSGKKVTSLVHNNEPKFGNIKANYVPINHYNWRYAQAYDSLRRIGLRRIEEALRNAFYKKLNNVLESREFENIIQKNNIANIKAIPMGQIYEIIMALNKNYYDPKKPKPTTKTYKPRGPTKTNTQTQTNTNTNRQTQTNLPPKRNTSTPKRTFKNRFSRFFTRKSPKSPNFSPI